MSVSPVNSLAGNTVCNQCDLLDVMFILLNHVSINRIVGMYEFEITFFLVVVIFLQELTK